MSAQPRVQVVPNNDTYQHSTDASKRCPCGPAWRIGVVANRRVWIAVHRMMIQAEDRSTWRAS